MEDKARLETIQRFNDLLRVAYAGGEIVLSDGVRALHPAQVSDVMRCMREFKNADQFGPEHSFGVFEALGKRFVFLITYYDRAWSGPSPDPANPRVTSRFLALMLETEYENGLYETGMDRAA